MACPGVGAKVGLSVAGALLGPFDGLVVGDRDRASVGLLEGESVAFLEGDFVGPIVGFRVGENVGSFEGPFVGWGVFGDREGALDGLVVGALDDAPKHSHGVGLFVGQMVGDADGPRVSLEENVLIGKLLPQLPLLAQPSSALAPPNVHSVMSKALPGADPALR